jgi:hypothetical protein
MVEITEEEVRNQLIAQKEYEAKQLKWDQEARIEYSLLKAEDGYIVMTRICDDEGNNRYGGEEIWSEHGCFVRSDREARRILKLLRKDQDEK